MGILDPKRYREAEVTLELDLDGDTSFHGFVPCGRVYGWLKHWTRVAAGTSWSRTSRATRRIASAPGSSGSACRRNGTATSSSRATRRTGGEPSGSRPTDTASTTSAAGARASSDRTGVDWLEFFPPWPDGDLYAATIARLLDTPLPKGMHSQNRQPVYDRIDRRARSRDLVEALSLARTDDARERLAILLAYRRRPSEVVPPCRLWSTS